MCGIAGYSLAASSTLERTLTAQALLAGIAERGADAVGYAHRSPGESVSVHKQRSRASALLDEVTVPRSATEVLVHVRDYTKGHPKVAANNHPIRHGAVVGVHNGIIFNDDELLAAHECARCEPGMTVDSEAIFAVAAHSDGDAEALEALRGSMATAWIDERREQSLSVARGVGRPVWLGVGEAGTFFASTEVALEVVERYLGMDLEKTELAEGTLVELEQGRETSRKRFNPNREFEEAPLPAVRAPNERVSCLNRLATIVATAGYSA
jgi:glucosamine 6-phosphate synthetase-like amidotransferase/phosphosugar isomerase protein